MLLHYRHLFLPLFSFLPSILAAKPSSPLSGPLTSSIFADPSVIKVGNTYYAYATQNAPYSVPVAKSTDFENWTVLAKDALPNPGQWAKKGDGKSIWAPDVIQSPQGRFIMYYSAVIKESANKDRCIGAALSSDPEGPFEPMEKAAVCIESNTIDPAGYIAPDGSHYLLYRSQLPKAHIMMQPLLNDGVTPRGAPIKLIQSTRAEGWNTEAPSLIEVRGTWYLFYSTQPWWTSKYTVSVATASKLEGPYTKAKKPVLFTDGQGPGGPVAPGGADVLFSPDNIKALDDGWSEVKIVFHAAGGKDQLRKRYLWTGLLKVKGSQVKVL